MKSNIQLQGLISELRKQANLQNAPLWKRVACELEKPTRHRRVVNLSKIARYGKEDEIIIVPGKILGNGELGKKLSIASYDISCQAKEKLKSSDCKYYSIMDLLKTNPKGKRVRIIG